MGLDHRIGKHFLKPGIGFGGSCFAPEETVLVRHRGRTTLQSFKQLWRRLAAEHEELEDGLIEPSNLEVLSWVPGGEEPQFLPVMCATRRDYDGELVEVRTKMGRRLRTTPDHGWIVGDGNGGEPEFKLAADVTTEDWVPLALGVSARSGRGAEVSALMAAAEAAELSPRQLIVRPDRDRIAELVRRPTDERRRVFAGPASVAARTGDVKRTGTLRHDELLRAGIALEGSTISTTKSGNRPRSELRLDGLFWRVVGLYLAEGNTYVEASGRHRIQWSFHPTREQHLADEVDGVLARAERTSARLADVHRPAGRGLLASARDLVDRGARPGPPQLRAAPPRPDLGPARRGALGLAVRACSRATALVADQRRAERDHRDGDGQRRARGRRAAAAGQRRDRRLAARRSDVRSRPRTRTGSGSAAPIRSSGRSGSSPSATVPASWPRSRGSTSGSRRPAIAASATDPPGCASPPHERQRYRGPVYSMEVSYAHTVVGTAGMALANCFPKDVSALKQLAGNSGYHFQLLTAVIEVNELQKRRVVGKLQKHLGSLVGKTIALLGLAFKANTDDMREASSLVLAARLQADGARVRAYDPIAEDRGAQADDRSGVRRLGAGGGGRRRRLRHRHRMAGVRRAGLDRRCATGWPAGWSSTAATSWTRTRSARPASRTRESGAEGTRHGLRRRAHVVQALILAGGEGTRLRPLTSTMPKPVVPLVDRPFIVYMLEWLRGHGVDEAILSCGFMADGVRSVLGDGSGARGAPQLRRGAAPAGHRRRAEVRRGPAAAIASSCSTATSSPTST